MCSSDLFPSHDTIAGLRALSLSSSRPLGLLQVRSRGPCAVKMFINIIIKFFTQLNLIAYVITPCTLISGAHYSKLVIVITILSPL